MKSSQIGVQLYTLRAETARDMPATLRRLAEIGYGAVEFAGFGNSSPTEIRQVLDEQGIVAIGAHVALVDLETRLHQALAECQILGCEYAVVPSVPDSWRETAADVTRLAERLNSLGELCRAEGIRLGYHNHAVEFAPLDGTTAWEILARDTSPDLVDLELDLYWAAHAGVDPAALLRRDRGRVRLVHAKDMALDSDADAPVGEGRLHWPEILDAAGDDVRWYIVEQDEPGDAFPAVERALGNLRSLGGLPVA
jgi:sugar phosphate isomerase/epimerase